MLNFLLFITCYLGGFILAFMSNPAWSFVLYQLVYFMNPLERWWSYMIPSLSYSFFTVILMFAVFMKDFKAHQQNRLLSAPQFKWIYLIALGYILASFYAVIPFENEFATVNFVKLVIIMSVAYKLIDTDQKLTWTLWGFICGAAYIGLICFQVGRDAYGRIEGVGMVDSPDSNGTAAGIAPALVLALYFFWVSKSPWKKLAAAVTGAFIANGIVLINSRGSFLAVIASLGYFSMFLLFSKHQRKHQKASAIGLMFLGLIAAAVIVDETAIERFLTIKTEERTEDQETAKTRTFFWLAALEMAKDHPFGGGAKAFEAYAPEYLPDYLDTGASRNRSVHSSWFEALTDLGYPGLFFLIMMIRACFFATRRSKHALINKSDIDNYYKLLAIEAALIAYMVAMSFMNRYRAEVLYWCVLFTACAYNIYVLKGTESAKAASASATKRPKAGKQRLSSQSAGTDTRQ